MEFQRRDGSRFPGEATVSKVDVARRGVRVRLHHATSPSALRRQAEREALLREQAARAEAERVAEIVGGMQALVDAALAHRTLDGILRDLVTQVRGVLDADAATIYLADESERLERRARRRPAEHDRRRRGSRRAWPRRARRCSPRTTPCALVGVPLLAEGEVTGVLVAGAHAAARVQRGGPHAAAARRRARGPRDRPRARLRARAPDRRDASAQPAAGPPAAPARARGGGALPAGRLGGRGGRRLVRRDPDRRRRASAW